MSRHWNSVFPEIHRNARATAIVLPLLACAITVAGCCVCPAFDNWSVFRDYRVALAFAAYETKQSSITLASRDSSTRIIMYADGYRTAMDSNDYKLRLYLHVYDLGMTVEREFHPENIGVSFDKRDLEYQGIRSYRETKGAHLFDIEFHLSSTDGTEPVLSKHTNKPEYPITVDMSEFVLVDSGYAAYDTVHAIQREYIHVSENDDYSPFD